MDRGTRKHLFETVRKSREFLFAAAVCLLFGAFAFQLWFHATRTSATVDEVQHIFAGYRHWQCGDFAVNPEHPPLLKLLAASPLLFGDFQDSASWECGSRPTSKAEASVAGFSFIARNSPERVVTRTRLAAAAFSLLLATFVFLAAREMFGRREAFVALALLVFEPNIIAHGSLVTTDAAVSAGFFIAVYALYRYRKNPSLAGFLALGAAIGLTLSVKHSGILVVPVLFALLISDLLLFRRVENHASFKRRLARACASFAGAVFVGWILLWACYGFKFYALPKIGGETILTEVFPPQTPEGKPPSLPRRTLKTVTNVFPEAYTVGLADVISSSDRPMFLLGEIYPSGKWFYFPAAFLIKTSLALLVLLASRLLFFKFSRCRTREMLFLLLPPLAFFGVALSSKMNIGVRHILPVYAFFIVVAAASACAVSRRRKFASWALIALLAVHAAAAYRTAPNYLAFSNILWGGTNNTHRLLADSNVEWGQNLNLVNEYLRAEKIDDCWFASYGGGELARRGVPCRLMPGGYAWNATDELIEPIPDVVEGTVLLSVAVLPPFGENRYSAITASEPAALIGGSVFVYRGRFEVPLASALSYAARSEQLVRLNRFREAIADASRAVEAAPQDPRPHLALGAAFARDDRASDAQRELEIAVRFAESNAVIFGDVKTAAQAELARISSKN